MKSQHHRRMTRRRFLQRTLAAAAGIAAAPALVPDSVLGAAAPSERITLGFIGTGKQGTFLLKNFLNEPGTEVLAVCDVDRLKKERAQRITNAFYADRKTSGTYNGCTMYEDYQDVLAREDIDAVVIATPDHWKALTVIHSARAGKDIYAEKPLSQTISEGQRMVREVRRHERVFQTGSMQRSDQKFRFACELVRNGYIGDIQHVTVDVGGPPELCNLPAEPVPEYLNWDRWLGPVLWRPYNSELSPNISLDIFPHWRNYRAFGGGGMTDWGAHHFDIAQWGLGMDDSDPVEVHPPDGKQYKVLTYKYANGVTMTRDTFPEGHGVLFTGSDGKVEVNRSYMRTWPANIAQVQLGPKNIHLYKSDDHYADFLQAVRNRSKPICDISVGFHSVVVCHLGNLAYQLNRSLRWNPDAEAFVDDPEASRLLSRPYRKPYHL